MNPLMTPREREVLSSFLRRSNHYFEFGMGGSTVLASNLVRGSVSAIDSEPDWVDKVGRAVRRDGPAIDLSLVDIGPVGSYGIPLDRSDPKRFHPYSGAIAHERHARVDLCFVDGRFRVACALQAFVSLGPRAFVVVHDYANRPRYRLIEQFGDCVAACDTLAVFRRKRLGPRRHLLLRRRLAQFRENHR